MTKNSKSKQANLRKAVARLEQRIGDGGKLRASMLTSPHQYLIAMRDPFQPEAAGVKLPDYDGNPSFTVASKDVFLLQVNAAGYGGGYIQFGTSGRNQVQALEENAGATVDMHGATAHAWSDYTSGLLNPSNSVASRMITGGLKISNLLSIAGSQAAQGRLLIAPVSNAAVFNTRYLTESLLRKQPGAMVIPLAALATSAVPVVCLTRPLDPSAHCYFPPGLNLTGVADNDPQFLSFAFLIVGAPALSLPLEVEMVAHWEVLPVLANAVLTTPGVESSTKVMETAVNEGQLQEPVQFGPENSPTMRQAAKTSLSSFLRVSSKG